MSEPQSRRSVERPVVPQEASWRRIVVGVVAVFCLCLGWYQTTQSAGDGLLGRSVFLRAGVALSCLWIAWPSLVRPARWLPPSILLAAMIGLGVLIAQPKLVPAMIPLFGLLTTAAIVITFVRKIL